MRAAGIACVLLKGATLIGWLYAEGESRPYSDADLLVPPRRYADAGAVLAGLGYAPSRAPQAAGFHARGWRRSSDGAIVDLHRTLPATRCDPAVVWRVVSERVERRSMMGEEVDMPSTEARALLIALHHAHHAGEEHPFARKTLTELQLAVRRVSPDTWRRSAQLATRLDCRAPLARGLYDDPAGAELARRLGVPPPDWFARRPDGRLSAALERLAATPGLAAKAWMLGRALAPSRDHMRSTSPLARRGRLGLVAAYLLRPVRAVRIPRE